MTDFRVRKLGQGQMKARNVPIAVTPEGFWCCPSPAVLQKTIKNQNHQNKKKILSTMPSKASSSVQRPISSPVGKGTLSDPLSSRVVSDDNSCLASDAAAKSPTKAAEGLSKLNVGNQHQKISVGFGQPETSDLKIILFGKEGIAIEMSVHKAILTEHGSFFADKFSRQSPVPFFEIADCEDVEIYVETVGLMYCGEVKHRVIKQSVSRVLRILKVAESLGFHACIKACLDFLEVVPWVGEEGNVVSSVQHLQSKNYSISPILKRVFSDTSKPPNDTLAHIMELVLRSNEERGRREMKSLVLKLLKENSFWTDGSVDICIGTLYSLCQSCLASLIELFRQASKSPPIESKDPTARKIALEAENLLWLVEILAVRHTADEFALMWASQNELAQLHSKLPAVMSRHRVSCITARLFVGIGRGEMLPSKETRQLLLHVWLQPLVDDYSWLQHGCRQFDRKVVEEGIGQTILTLPLEDQQSVLLSWLESFLKVGGNCPNLQRAFEVWWRRTFIRPYFEQHGNNLKMDRN
ncbi:BTB POZ domain-containing protein [Musa troglodytarum]|uniref:BTB POZ domain-containing protein n=1 Tax=Musa troglodytarum TaxID=320322 RepID=A0A9E7FMH2_9LILI|nr:BTB POZ domain-containing protein [Musa troglodytarum]